MLIQLFILLLKTSFVYIGLSPSYRSFRLHSIIEYVDILTEFIVVLAMGSKLICVILGEEFYQYLKKQFWFKYNNIILKKTREYFS